MRTGPAGVTAPAAGALPAPRRVSARQFVRLKLRVLANNFRGQGWRIALFVVGGVFALWFAGTGLLLLSLPGLSDNAEAALLTAALGGGLLVVGWVLLPLVFFGVDETLDPARFALLPLPRRTLLVGLLSAALIGLPAGATLIATAGIVVTAALIGGWPAALAASVGVLGGLLLCVAASRAVTSAFATMLRSRRVRDLAAALLAVAAAMIGPVQIAVVNAAERADWDRLAGVAQIVGWTPLGAPYTLGVDVAEGRAWAVPLKVLVTAATIVALMWWWSRSLESAMVGAAASGPGRASAQAPGGAVGQLFPQRLRWLRRDRYGALVAREVRYWWRDSRRRASLITFAVVGIVVPVMVNIGSRGSAGGRPVFDASATVVSLSMVFVGVLAAVTLANQFGWDGTAYAANVVAGVPGRVELRARIVAFCAYILPMLIVVAVVVAFFLREPRWIGVMVGTLFAAYGSGLAVNLMVSVLGAYALPETANPFALNSGAGAARSLLAFVGMIASGAVAVPMVVATALLGDLWLLLALPVGIGYGFGATTLGIYVAGDLLDRRQPELLQAVTPRR
ncbi:MAG TPA: ABC transporter permease [Micromonosporaceae bacterium]|nr:ABC transporter permease [Micromonosporaceae bacterium]